MINIYIVFAGNEWYQQFGEGGFAWSVFKKGVIYI